MSNKELAAKAAKWWASHLTVNQKPGWMGGHTVDEAVGETMLDINQPAAPADEAVIRFTSVLTRRLEQWLDERDGALMWVDYRPDDFLEEVTVEAQVPPGRLPKRTGMHIRGGKIFVRAGQGSPETELK